MNQSPFIRKIIYLAILVVLLIPLSLLSMPSRPAAHGEPASAGGKLAQLRDKHKLGQANLGQIDPTSEALKLATLGMRGFAANIMWTKANTYAKKQDWTGLSAALQQITKLQPNFVTVWQFQGWNLAYNISYEFDDYRDRYFWVMKGVRFLQEGVKYNENSPKLVWNVGWVIAQKIGIADEKVQFRRLFREDNDFHGPRPLAQRDNWLVGRQYYVEAEEVAKREGILDTLNPLVFMFHAPKARINYAIALEDDGVFEERAAVAWNEAKGEWSQFGDKDIRANEMHPMRLNDYERTEEQINKLSDQLDALPPAGRFDVMHKEKLAALTPEERAAFEMSPDKRAGDEHQLAVIATSKMAITPAEHAEKVDAEHRAEAQKLAGEIAELQVTLQQIDRGRGVINFPYWVLRCEMECQPETIEARQLIYEADKARTSSAPDLPAAKALFDKGFAKWDEVLKKYPKMRSDDLFGDDMAPYFKRYIDVLKARDEPFPDKFPLQDLLDTQRMRDKIQG